MRINPVLDTYHMYYGQKRKAIAINTVSDLSTTTGEAAETEKLPYFPLQNNCVNFTILLLLLKSNPSTIMSFNMIKCTTKLTNVKSKFCKKKFRKQRSQQLHVKNKHRVYINASPQCTFGKNVQRDVDSLKKLFLFTGGTKVTQIVRIAL